MGSVVLLIFASLITVYTSAFLSSLIVLKEGAKGFSNLLTKHVNNVWKWGLASLIGLSSFGFYWSELVKTEGTIKSFLVFLLGAFFHLAGLLLIVYLFIFVPLRIFKINKSEASQAFVSRLNLILFPFATIYIGGLIFIGVQLGFALSSFSDPNSVQLQSMLPFN